MSKIQIVTVVHNWECYDKNIKDNPNMKNYEIVTFDNSKKPVAITKRYNDYIKKNILTDKVQDTWVVFCHQDFSFTQDPMDIICKLDKGNIYSTIGYSPKKYHKIGLKKILGMLCPCFKSKSQQLGEVWGSFEPSKMREQGQTMKKEAEHLEKEKTFKCGDEYLRIYGKKVHKPMEVDTLSSCCIIMYSDLIKEKELLFDENLDFFMYGEELSLNARFNKGIKAIVIPCDCKRSTDKSPERDALKKQALDYLKSKYSDKKFCTSYDCYPNIGKDK